MADLIKENTAQARDCQSCLREVREDLQKFNNSSTGRDAPKKDTWSFPGNCFNCGKTGHKAKKCTDKPRRRMINAIKEGDEEAKSEFSSQDAYIACLQCGIEEEDSTGDIIASIHVQETQVITLKTSTLKSALKSGYMYMAFILSYLHSHFRESGGSRKWHFPQPLAQLSTTHSHSQSHLHSHFVKKCN